MKNLSVLLLMIILLSCSKEDVIPTPEPIIDDTTTTTGPPVIEPYNYQLDFNGNWDCYDWSVNGDITHHRRFLITMDTTYTSLLHMSLNDYNSAGTMSQLISFSLAYIDSNYFDLPGSPSGMKFKGYLLTDSTMMVSKYDGSTIDQSKVFKKEQ